MSIKRIIKEHLPDKVVYFYKTVELCPKFIGAYFKNRCTKFPDLKMFSDEETINLIVKQRKSLSRFGDGEFMWMCGEHLGFFQTYSDQFASDLRAAFQNQNENLLVGIPRGIIDTSGCNMYAKMHWTIVRSGFWTRLIKLVDIEKYYCNASISRPYIDYKDRTESAQRFIWLKKIWDNRDVVIVEGEKTKLGLGNDLFSNARSIKRIICPAQDAYEKIEDIKNSIRKFVDKDTLLLGALGPTASILAAQLSLEGYQFVDIGHVDVEYMWFLKHAILREPIEGKHVNESGNNTCSDLYDDDPIYIGSIIDKIL